MDEMYFRISRIQKKIDANHELQTILKAIGGLIVFTIFVCSIRSDTMKVAWMISMLFIPLLFCIDAYYMKSSRRYELEIYQLKVDSLESKKKIAAITGEALPDILLKREIRKPPDAVSLPVLYYAILFILDILVKVLMIH